MQSIEQFYTEIIRNPRKWMYWDYDENTVQKFRGEFSDFSSIYQPEKASQLIEMLLYEGAKDRGSLVQNIEKLDPKRKIHIVSLFFMGHVLYENIDSIRTKVNRQLVGLRFPKSNDGKSEEQKLFSFMWILLCLFHDLGYAYEKGELSVDNLMPIEGISRKLKVKFYPTIYSAENIERHNDYRLCKWGVKDHGIWGGKVFFNDMLQIKKFLEQDAYMTKKTGMFCVGDVDHIYAYAAWIIMCHNLRFNDGTGEYFRCFKCQHLDSFIKRKARCISLKSNPLLFLFCLADTIEPTKVLCSEDSNPNKSRDICKLLELEIKNDDLSFDLNQLKDYSAYEKYSRNISSMNDWLVDVSDKFLISF